MEALDAGAEGGLVLAATDVKDGFPERGPLTDGDRAAIEQGWAASFYGPCLTHHRIMDDADHDFTRNA